ncbi:hypothetical protein ScPMuIL_005215, partial [Solemya velum]
IQQWKNITDDLYILDVISSGYKLPFQDIPMSVHLGNNRSARECPDFVNAEVETLLLKGIISKVIEKPHVINPLTAAYNKSAKPD